MLSPHKGDGAGVAHLIFYCVVYFAFDFVYCLCDVAVEGLCSRYTLGAPAATRVEETVQQQLQHNNATTQHIIIIIGERAGRKDDSNNNDRSRSICTQERARCGYSYYSLRVFIGSATA